MMTSLKVVMLGSLLGLQVLDDHLHTIIGSTLFFHIVFVLSLWWSKGNPHYDKLKPIKQLSWGMHVVSAIHAPVAVFASIPILLDPVLMKDPMNGYTYYAGQVCAFSCGYFLWDTILSIYTWTDSGIGFIFHGVACFLVFFCSFVV